MKKFFACALACLVVCNTAQAAIYTFEYTALVSKVELGSFSQATTIPIGASNLAGGTISTGDKVTGIISYDSNAHISSTYSYNGVTSISYGYLASLDLTAHFIAADVNFAPNGYKYAGSSYGNTTPGTVDEFYAGTYRYLSLPGGAITREVLSLSLGDSTNTKISNKLPGAEAVNFDSNSLLYEFADNTQDQRLLVTSTITEMKFIQSAPVPEPETYAMLLAGLAVIGWNRRRKTATA